MFKRKTVSSAAPNLLSSRQVLAAVPGLTARKLQWWDEHKIIECDHMEGHSRIYDRSQVAGFALLIELGKRGLSLQKANRLRRMIFIDMDRGYGFIVTDGKKLKIADTPDDAIGEAVKFSCGVHLIDLADLRKRVKL